MIRTAARVAAALLAFAPALACAVLIAQHAVDVPVGGDWTRADVLAGNAGLDPRSAAPQLVARINLNAFGNDLRLEMALAWVLALATALCVHGLLRATLGTRPGRLYGSTFLANLLLFSPLQWENLLWADRALSLLPSAALCASLFAVRSGPPGAFRFATCAFLASIATLTAPHALPLWAAIFIALAAPGEGASPGRRRAFLAGWTLLALAALALHGAGNGLAGGTATLRSSATMLGGAFSRTTLIAPRELAPWAGALLTGLFALCAAWPLAAWRDAAAREKRLPWVLLGGYALLLAVASPSLLGATRPEDALLPRHSGVSLSLCVATIPLGILALDELRRRLAASRPRLTDALDWAPAFVAGILLVAAGLGWLVGGEGMAEWKSARLQARTALVFLDRFEPRHVVRFGASLPEVRRAADILERHGALEPHRASGDGIGPYTVGAALAVDSGRVERVTTTDTRLALKGFAWLPGPDRRADGVLVTARVGDGPRRAVALAELEGLVLPPIPEHDYVYNDARIPGIDERATWAVGVAGTSLPAAPLVVLEAFAVDSEVLGLHRIGDPIPVRVTPDGMRATTPGGDAP